MQFALLYDPSSKASRRVMDTGEYAATIRVDLLEVIVV